MPVPEISQALYYLKSHGFKFAEFIGSTLRLQKNPEYFLGATREKSVWMIYRKCGPIQNGILQRLLQYEIYSKFHIVNLFVIESDRGGYELCIGLPIVLDNDLNNLKNIILDIEENHYPVIMDIIATQSVSTDKGVHIENAKPFTKSPGQVIIKGEIYSAVKKGLLSALYSNAPNLVLVCGRQGVGKRTILAELFEEEGFSGFLLDREYGLNSNELVKKYTGIVEQIKQAITLGGKGLVMVMSPLLTDYIFSEISVDRFQLTNIFIEAADHFPVVLISNKNDLKGHFFTQIIRVEEENEKVIHDILANRFADDQIGVYQSHGEQIANPLFSIKMIESGQTTKEPKQKAGSFERGMQHCIAELDKLVMGQSGPINKIVPFLYSYFLRQFNDSSETNPVIFVSGPSGVGKTMLAKELAKYLNVNWILIECNKSLSAEMNLTSIIGSTPGYVGYGDPAPFDDLRPGNDKDNSFGTVVIFDEIEKAEPKFINTFLSWLQEGKIPNKGGYVKLNRNLLYFTSNLGSLKISAGKIGFGESNAMDKDGFEDIYWNSKELPVEFKSRVGLYVEFNRVLNTEQVYELIGRELDLFFYSLRIRYEDKEGVITQIYSQLQEREKLSRFGLRMIRAEITRLFANILADIHDRGEQDMEHVIGIKNDAFVSMKAN